MLNVLLQRYEGEPQGLPFAVVCFGLATSSVVRSVALWFVAPVGFVYSLLKAFLLPLFI